MSVLIIDLEVFGQVAHAMHHVSFNRVCDDLYSHAVHTRNEYLPDVFEECQRFAKSLCELNELSYNIKYKDEPGNLADFIEFEHSDIKAIPLLKNLQCIRYNIEKETIEEKQKLTSVQVKDLELLDLWIEDLRTGIISQLPEYKKAGWGHILQTV